MYTTALFSETQLEMRSQTEDVVDAGSFEVSSTTFCVDVGNGDSLDIVCRMEPDTATNAVRVLILGVVSTGGSNEQCADENNSPTDRYVPVLDQKAESVRDREE